MTDVTAAVEASKSDRNAELIAYVPGDTDLPGLYAGSRPGGPGALWDRLPAAIESVAGAVARSTVGGGGLAGRASRWVMGRWVVGQLPAARRNLAAAHQRRLIQSAWDERFADAARTAHEADVSLRGIVLTRTDYGSLLEGRRARRSVESAIEKILLDHDPALLAEIDQCCAAWAVRRALNDMGPARLLRAVGARAQDEVLHSPHNRADVAHELRAASVALRSELSKGLDSMDELQAVLAVLPREQRDALLSDARSLGERAISQELERFARVAHRVHNDANPDRAIVTLPAPYATHREYREAHAWKPTWQGAASHIPLIGKRWK